MCWAATQSLPQRHYLRQPPKNSIELDAKGYTCSSNILAALGRRS